MNQTVRLPSAKRIGYSACPHDCPSTCALEVELVDERTIGRVHGAADNDYTAGVVCAKVARYAEREHHPQRLLHPLRRRGAKGSGEFEQISWDAALDLVAEKFIKAEQQYGAESIWPYYYAGTMGLVMRDGINRLRHVKNIPASIRRFASIPPMPDSRPGSAASRVSIRGKWPNPI
jgi:Anaerobic dehydrogenases, typically selenocysteine-containing